MLRLCLTLMLILAATLAAGVPATGVPDAGVPAAGKDLPPVPAPQPLLVPCQAVAELARYSPVQVIHDYGAAVLVSLGDTVALPQRLASRLHLLDDTRSVSFRSWNGQLPQPEAHRIGLLPEGHFLLGLVGPPDRSWQNALQRLGLTILGNGHPYGLVVHGDGPQLAAALQLTTSSGFRVIRGLLPLPVEARMSRQLAEILTAAPGDQELEVVLSAFSEAALQPLLKRHLLTLVDTRLKHVPDGTARVRLTVAAATALLAEEVVSYAEPVYEVSVHNNLAARSHLIDAETVWNDLGFNGTGVIVAHNDSGIDLAHPDLPSEVIVALNGRQDHPENVHGTHTAGTIIGRGGSAAPENTSGCGDLTAALPEVRGIAWGARMVSNNICTGGIDDIVAMMQWAVGLGASISANSWGFRGEVDEVYAYSAAAAQVDAAVRDGDPLTRFTEPLAVFFAAGNLGPDQGTVTSPGTAKNVVTVGASHNDRCGAYIPVHNPGPDLNAVLLSSSRGPTQGRIKPDLVAPGSDLLSLESSAGDLPWDADWTGQRYGLDSGTSMACAVAAGAAAVFTQAHRSSTGFDPSPALIKAAFINTAVNLGYRFGSCHQGWGRLDLRQAISGPPSGRIILLDQDETAVLATGQQWSWPFEVVSAAEPLKLTLVWTDVPGEADAEQPLVNDLDLLATAPDGTRYRGNRFANGPWSNPDSGQRGDRKNNVENIFVEAPVAGEWMAEVVAVSVASDPPGLDGQDFAVACSGDVADPTVPPAPAGVCAVATGDNSVDITWDDHPEGIIEHAVFRRLDPGDPYQLLGLVRTPQSWFSDAWVSGGIDSRYVVRARSDRNRWSAFSAEAVAATGGPCFQPPAFAGLQRVEEVGRFCSLQLVWQPASAPCGGEVVYAVHRAVSPRFTPTAQTCIASSLTSTTFTDTGLEHGQRYCYLVRATDTSNGLEDGNLAQRWGAAPGYREVYFFDDVESGRALWRTGPGSEADSDTIEWWITSADNEAHSPTHSWRCISEHQVKDQALSLAAPVDIPAGVPAVLEFWHRYLLSVYTDGGRLEYSVNGGASWHDILDGDDGATIPANRNRFLSGGYDRTLLDSSMNDNPLAGQEAWSGSSGGWQLVAVDLSDLAGRSLLLRWRLGCDRHFDLNGVWWVDDIRIEQRQDCQPCVPGPPPAGVAVVTGENGITLSWEPVEAAVAYRLLRSQQSGGPYMALTTVAPPATSHLDRDVSGGTTYFYVVQVLTDCLSEQSPEVSVVASGPCTLAPLFSGLISARNAPGPSCAVELIWPPAVSRCHGATLTYRVYRSRRLEQTGDAPSLLVENLSGTSYLDRAVMNGGSYHYLVRAVDSDSMLADDNRVTVSAVVSGATVLLLEDDLESGAGLWHTAIGSAADAGSEPWQLVRGQESHSPEHAWFCSNESRIKDQTLSLAVPVVIPADVPAVTLELWHRFDLESPWDGGCLEYSVDGGQSWHDILCGDDNTVPANPDRFLAGGYTRALLATAGNNPLAGRQAWTGEADWSQVLVDLTDLRGTSLALRWRLGCNVAAGDTGWWIDDVRISFPTPCTIPPRTPSGRAAS